MCYYCSGYQYPYYAPYQSYSPYPSYSPYQYYNYPSYAYGYGYPMYGFPLGYVYASPAMMSPAPARGEYHVGNCLMICQ